MATSVELGHPGSPSPGAEWPVAIYLKSSSLPTSTIRNRFWIKGSIPITAHKMASSTNAAKARNHFGTKKQDFKLHFCYELK